MPTLTPLTRRFALAGAASLMLALSSCAMPTPYAPASGTGYARTGYSDEQIETDRYRVSFAGNSITARDTVERYLLYRSAQLTVEKGFDYFVLVNRDTEKKSRTVVDSDPFYSGPWGYWGPSWHYYRRGFGWGIYDPFYDPFWDRSVDVRTIDKYEATAEVKLGKGPKPADDLHAFDARDVLAKLGPQIQMPKAN